MVSAHGALQRLREGNLRFASDERGSDAFVSHTRRAELTRDQQPFAIILGCSDSRVPAEIVFDQGLGDLFVIRVAGNVVASSQVGSVEFAPCASAPAWWWCSGTPVRRHPCHPRRVAGPREPVADLRSIVDRVGPSVEALLAPTSGTTSTPW